MPAGHAANRDSAEDDPAMSAGDRASAGDAAALDAAEQGLVDRVAERRDELVALVCELIGYDTTSRSSPDEPAREEAALQRALAARLEPYGAEIDLSGAGAR